MLKNLKKKLTHQLCKAVMSVENSQKHKKCPVFLYISLLDFIMLAINYKGNILGFTFIILFYVMFFFHWNMREEKSINRKYLLTFAWYTCLILLTTILYREQYFIHRSATIIVNEKHQRAWLKIPSRLSSERNFAIFPHQEFSL